MTYQPFTGPTITNLSWPHLSLHPGPSHSFLLACPLFCPNTNWPDLDCMSMSMPFWHPSWTSRSPRMKPQVTFTQQNLITPQNMRFINKDAVKTSTPMYLHFESKGFFCFFFLVILNEFHKILGRVLLITEKPRPQAFWIRD